jgi:hypothetical protein
VFIGVEPDVARRRSLDAKGGSFLRCVSVSKKKPGVRAVPAFMLFDEEKTS